MLHVAHFSVFFYVDLNAIFCYDELLPAFDKSLTGSTQLGMLFLVRQRCELRIRMHKKYSSEMQNCRALLIKLSRGSAGW